MEIYIVARDCGYDGWEPPHYASTKKADAEKVAARDEYSTVLTIQLNGDLNG